MSKKDWIGGAKKKRPTGNGGRRSPALAHAKKSAWIGMRDSEPPGPVTVRKIKLP